jgi:type IV secretion system protein VirB10
VREPVPSPAPKPKQPDPIALAARAAYASRAQGGWQSIAVPVSLPKTGPAASLDARAAVSKMPARPLDLAAVVRSQGDEEYQEKERISSLPVDNSRLIATDRWIPVIAENGINTQLDGSGGGTVILQVSDNVFGYHGRNILIPKGSRLVCGYKPLDKVGSSRAPLRCGRMLMGGHRAEIYGMKANAMDMQGKLGVSGDVDNRFWEKYGTAFILTGISTAVRIATTSKTTNESIAAQSNALDTGGEELAQRLGEITAETLKQTLPLNPILNVAQGTRLQILPDTDWYIADPNNPRKPRIAKE